MKCDQRDFSCDSAPKGAMTSDSDCGVGGTAVFKTLQTTKPPLNKTLH